MERRNFLKGILAAGAIAALPALPEPVQPVPSFEREEIPYEDTHYTRPSPVLDVAALRQSNIISTEFALRRLGVDPQGNSPFSTYLREAYAPLLEQYMATNPALYPLGNKIAWKRG